MAFRYWQLGLHIQQDKVAVVALQRDRTQWHLRRWWCLPLEEGVVDQGQIIRLPKLVSALRGWRRELPLRHDVYLSFPAARTLQKSLPEPAMMLREPEQASWVTSAMTRALEMAPDALCVDYTGDSARRSVNVTAAQQQDIARLRALAAELHLRVAAIVPDACAMLHFLPWLTAPARGLVWSDNTQWLWATENGWGSTSRREASTLAQLAEHLGLDNDALVTCGHFDPWIAVTRRQPPLPDESEAFAIAIALAAGGTR